MHMPDLSTRPGSLGPLSLGHRAAGQVQQGAFSLSPGSSLSIRTLFDKSLPGFTSEAGLWWTKRPEMVQPESQHASSC